MEVYFNKRHQEPCSQIRSDEGEIDFLLRNWTEYDQTSVDANHPFEGGQSSPMCCVFLRGHGSETLTGRSPVCPARQLASVEPLQVTAPSASAGPKETQGGGISFTIPPTDQDVRQMHSGRYENGRIKRPLNGFMVWSCIHRRALNEAGEAVKSTRLGLEWSKLTDEQKRPYFEVAQRLKDMHGVQFPDYTFCPKKKDSVTHLPSMQGAGQSEGQKPAVSSFIPHSIQIWASECTTIVTPYAMHCSSCVHSGSARTIPGQ